MYTTQQAHTVHGLSILHTILIKQPHYNEIEILERLLDRIALSWSSPTSKQCNSLLLRHANTRETLQCALPVALHTRPFWRPAPPRHSASQHPQLSTLVAIHILHTSLTAHCCHPRRRRRRHLSPPLSLASPLFAIAHALQLQLAARSHFGYGLKSNLEAPREGLR